MMHWFVIETAAIAKTKYEPRQIRDNLNMLNVGFHKSRNISDPKGFRYYVFKYDKDKVFILD